MNQDQHLIIGGGIAGCAIAFAFWQAGEQVLLLNDEVGDAASAVAAGLFNPITGSRFVKTWMAESVFDHLHPFYQSWETLLKTKCYHPIPIVRPFGSVEEQNTAIAKTAEPDYAAYIEATDLPNGLTDLVRAPLGGMVFGQGGWVDIPLLMSQMHLWLKANGQYQVASVHPQDLIETQQGVVWQGQTYKSATFCTGYRASLLGGPIKFSPVRGEIISIKLSGDLTWPNLAVSKGIYILGAGHELKVGATYNWRQPTPTTSPEGLAELTQELDKVLQTNYEVTGHWAGVRPAIADRRPVAGLLPNCTIIGMLNGLGSKGTSLAPWLATALVNFYLTGEPMPAAVSPHRFDKKR